MGANSKKTETMVGVFLLLGLTMLGTIILLFGNIGEFFKNRYEIKVSFKEAAGIIEGSTVRLRGTKVGKVAEKPILVGGSRVQIVLAIDEDQRIEEGSIFQIGQASLLGDKEIVITPPAVGSASFIDAGAEVTGAGPGGLDRLQSEAETIAEDTREVIREAKATLLKIEASVDEIGSVAKKLTVTMDKVNEKVLSPENVENLGGTLANLEKASGTFSELGDRLKPAVGDFRLAIDEVRETTKTAKAAIARVDPALEDVPRVLSSIENTANKATAAIEKVENKDSAIGALVSDKELTNDMKDFVRNLKENGILRYKDEDEKEEDPRDRLRGRRR